MFYTALRFITCFVLAGISIANASSWQQLVSTLEQEAHPDELSLIKAVNSRINQLQWQSDRQNWQRADYWATAEETLAAGKGDCEDLSIAKFSTLLALGVSESRLSLAYVKVVSRKKPHMVLTYQHQGQTLILDSLQNTIRKESNRPDLVKIYSFNRQHVWVGKKRFGTRILPSWERLLFRSNTQLASL